MKSELYVTTQRTAKKFKLQAALSTAVIVVGLLMVIQGAGSASGEAIVVWGCLLVLIGFTWKLINRVRIWWNHS